MRRSNSARRERAKYEIDLLIHGLIASCDSDGPTQAAFLRLIVWVRAHSDLTSVLDGARPGWAHVRSILFAMLALCRHHRAWCREVEAWEAPERSLWTQFASLARHLLAKSPVPEFMTRVWFEADPARAKVDQKLFKHLGRGGNIRGTDLNQLGRMLDNDHFRKEIIRLILMGWRWSPGELDLMVDYLAAQRFADVVGTTITRQTTRDLMDKARKWRREQLAVRRSQPRSRRSISRSWPPLPIPGLVHRDHNRQPWAVRYWTIRQLLNVAQLKEEGHALRHCVASYDVKCARRETTIWSLRQHGALSVEHLLTITLDPETRKIVYARGRRNSAPSQRARELLELWAEREELMIDPQVLSV